ncbi:hypothetical protein DPX16_21413 [Anabarilius grahami]|uniref:Uncharacterized protein n=1 Tax=Anabarilius grahami TaxID=495550 RepID=A0A3N0XV03_ANAGA|nr:hypothetical protein DPX16_21413 [Anabarilius grahami]
MTGRFLPLINGPPHDDLSVTSLAIHHYWRQSIVSVMDEARVRGPGFPDSKISLNIRPRSVESMMWARSGPNVGRIWANTMLLSGLGEK